MEFPVRRRQFYLRQLFLSATPFYIKFSVLISVGRTNQFQGVKITDTLSKQRDVESGFRTINQYVVHQTLGEGSFAKVKLVHVTHRPYVLFAMKVVHRGLNKTISDYLLSPLQPDQKQEELTINTEVAIMKKINHPNIVRLFEVIDDKSVNKLYMILELMKGGSCYKIGQQPLNEDDARSDIRDIIVGVSYMHKNHIVHHDIKPDNLLRNRRGIIKIGDFGLSSYYEDMTAKIRETKGTAAFIPPEAVDTTNYPDGYLPSLADIYSIGATLFMIIYGHPPYNLPNKYDLYKQIINEPIPFDSDENKETTKRISSDLRNLLEGTLEKDPLKRMTIEQMRQHPWVTYNGTIPLPDELEKVIITQQDLDLALTPFIPFHILIALKVQLRRRFYLARSRLYQQQIEKENQENQISQQNNIGKENQVLNNKLNMEMNQQEKEKEIQNKNQKDIDKEQLDNNINEKENIKEIEKQREDLIAQENEKNQEINNINNINNTNNIKINNNNNKQEKENKKGIENLKQNQIIKECNKDLNNNNDNDIKSEKEKNNQKEKTQQLEFDKERIKQKQKQIKKLKEKEKEIEKTREQSIERIIEDLRQKEKQKLQLEDDCIWETKRQSMHNKHNTQSFDSEHPLSTKRKMQIILSEMQQVDIQTEKEKQKLKKRKRKLKQQIDDVKSESVERDYNNMNEQDYMEQSQTDSLFNKQQEKVNQQQSPSNKSKYKLIITQSSIIRKDSTKARIKIKQNQNEQQQNINIKEQSEIKKGLQDQKPDDQMNAQSKT